MTPFDRVYSDWMKWFAWYPVEVRGKYVWLKTVYYRHSRILLGGPETIDYEYTDIFGVLANNENNRNEL